MSYDDEAMRRRLWYGGGIELPRITYTPGDAAAPDSALETLALIAEHRLTVEPSAVMEGGGWVPTWDVSTNDEIESRNPRAFRPITAEGRTIGDAVRACVARIKGER